MTIEEAEKRIEELEDKVCDLTCCVETLLDALEERDSSVETFGLSIRSIRRDLPNT